MYNPYDFYFKKAKKLGFKARSAFKLEEIQNKYKLIDKNITTVLDFGCAPGSRIQFVRSQLKKLGVKNFKIIGFDIKETNLQFPEVKTYQQDVTEIDKIEEILESEGIKENSVDLFLSDMAPNTIGIKEADAMRLFNLLNTIYPIMKKYLKKEGKFAIKVFMGPDFEEYLNKLKKDFGAKNIKVFKPQASRKNSKETYILKFR